MLGVAVSAALITSMPCTLAHIRAILPRLRAEDRLEIETVGRPIRHTLFDLWRNSYLRKAYIVNGEVAAVFGGAGMLGDDTVALWLFTTDVIDTVPVTFIKEARQTITQLLQQKRVLISSVMASHAKAIKTYRMLGFDVGAPRQIGATPHEFCQIQMRRGGRVRRSTDIGPFIVFSLPRSRTAWLSAFLSYGDWLCFHEHAMFMRKIDDIAQFFGQPKMGSIETAAGPGWYLLRHYVPNIRMVVVRRPVADVVKSLMAVDVAGVATYDEQALHKVMSYGDRMLDKISSLPGVLTVDHADLDNEDTCKAIFEFCLPYKFDQEWWKLLKHENIQIDVKNMLRYYHGNRAAIDAFKSACWRELRRLRKSGGLLCGIN